MTAARNDSFLRYNWEVWEAVGRVKELDSHGFPGF